MPASLRRLRGPLNAATRHGTVRPGSGNEALSAAASPCDNILSKQPINNFLTQVCGWKQPGKTRAQRAPLRHSGTAVGRSICVKRHIQWGLHDPLGEETEAHVTGQNAKDDATPTPPPTITHIPPPAFPSIKIKGLCFSVSASRFPSIKMEGLCFSVSAGKSPETAWL